MEQAVTGRASLFAFHRNAAGTDAREAEGSGLLSRPASDGRVGSNPTPSASECVTVAERGVAPTPISVGASKATDGAPVEAGVRLARASTPHLSRELLCQRCDREHPVWFAPNAVWNAIVRRADGTDEYAFLCPLCFITLAEERGMRPTGWIVAPEGALETVTTWRVVE